MIDPSIFQWSPCGRKFYPPCGRPPAGPGRPPPPACGFSAPRESCSGPLRHRPAGSPLRENRARGRSATGLRVLRSATAVLGMPSPRAGQAGRGFGFSCARRRSAPPPPAAGSAAPLRSILAPLRPLRPQAPALPPLDTRSAPPPPAAGSGRPGRLPAPRRAAPSADL